MRAIITKQKMMTQISSLMNDKSLITKLIVSSLCSVNLQQLWGFSAQIDLLGNEL